MEVKLYTLTDIYDLKGPGSMNSYENVIMLDQLTGGQTSMTKL